MSGLDKKRKSLGSWFPSASVIKSSAAIESNAVSICLFYQYVKPLWSESRKIEVIKYLEDNAEQLNIGGRLRVGPEGINATISSSYDNIREFTHRLGQMDKHFLETDFKYIDNLPPDRAFKEMKVLPVKELVYYGIAADKELGEGGVHLDPVDYHAKLGERETVVIDVRNAYESDIGRFDGQELKGGAELLVPDMRKSTDFPDWIDRPEKQEKIKGKNVLMYCTGGVRCERASALLKSKYGDTVNEVYQLQGGIEKYLQAFPDGGYWQGKNFVFDKREAIGVGCVEGVGGIVQEGKKKKAEKKEENSKPQEEKTGEEGKDDKNKAVTISSSPQVLGKCCACLKPWDRYIGKRKCDMCGVPVLLCTNCSSEKGMLDKDIPGSRTSTATTASTPDTTANKPNGKHLNRKQPKELEEAKKRAEKEAYIARLRVLRCPLCVAEGVTVAAHQIGFTANGTKAVWLDEGGGEESAVGSGENRSKSKADKHKSAPASTTTVAAVKNKKITFGDDDDDEAEGNNDNEAINASNSDAVSVRAHPPQQ